MVDVLAYERHHAERRWTLFTRAQSEGFDNSLAPAREVRLAIARWQPLVLAVRGVTWVENKGWSVRFWVWAVKRAPGRDLSDWHSGRLQGEKDKRRGCEESR